MNSLFSGLHPWRAAVQLFQRRGAALLALGFLFLALPSRAVDPPPDGRQFDTLTAGGVTYTKVTVIDVAKRHVSFRSAQGFSTVLIGDLEPEVRAKLGRGDLDLSDAWKEKPGTPGKGGDALTVKAREPGDKQGDGDEEAVDAGVGPDLPVMGMLNGPVDWSFKNIAAVSAMGLGLLVVFAAYCWFIGAAFRTSVGWGIAVLVGTFFAGIINVVFCCSHWKAARRPVYLKLAGVALICLGIFTLKPADPETAVRARENTSAEPANAVTKAAATISSVTNR